MPEVIRTRSRESVVMSTGRRLAMVMLEIERLQEESDKLRERLMENMHTDEEIQFTVSDVPFKLKKYKEEKEVLRSNEEIYNEVGIDAFVKIANVTLGKIKKIIGKNYSHLIAEYTSDLKVRLSKVRNGGGE